MLNVISFIFLQALSGGQQIKSLNDSSSLGRTFKEIGMAIAFIGVLCAGIAVVRKLMNQSDNVRNEVIAFFVALAVFYSLWSLL